MMADAEFPCIVELNVGGTFFTTRLTTLTRDADTMLAAMFSGRHQLDTDSRGRFFIDRDPSLFHHVLNFLRQEKLPPRKLAPAVLEEAEYYQIQGLVSWCKNQESTALSNLSDTVQRAHEASLEEMLLPVAQLAKEVERLVQLEPERLTFQGCDSITGLQPKVVEMNLAIIGTGLKNYNTMGPQGQLVQVGLATNCAQLGLPPDHLCRVGRWQIPKFDRVDLVVYANNRDCVADIAQSVARFNKARSSMSVHLQHLPIPRSPHGFNGKGGVVEHVSCLCVSCQRQIFYFELVFRFPQM